MKASAKKIERRVKEARGRKVTQLDPLAMYLLHDHSLIEADALRAIAHEPGVRITKWERAVLILGITCLVGVAGLLVHSVVLGDFGNAALARSSSLALFTFWPWVIWLHIKFARFDKVAAAMLKHGRCPHCGYSLCSLAAAEDGAIVCPECGCAWRLHETGQIADAERGQDGYGVDSEERSDG